LGYGRAVVRWWRLVVCGSIASLAAPPSRAFAHRDDYVDETFVFETLPGGELEAELWGDLREARDHRLSGLYTGALELGLTDRWMADAAVQALHDADGLAFARFRFESRARLADEGDWPIDVALSAEYELESTALGQDSTEHTISPRLVLSRDFVHELNTTLNLDLPVRISPSAEVSFAYAIGVRYPAEGVLRAGVEARHDVVDKRATVFPQVMLALPAEMTIKLGVGVGLTSTSRCSRPASCSRPSS